MVPCDGLEFPMIESWSNSGSSSLLNTWRTCDRVFFTVNESSTAVGGAFAETVTFTVPTSVPPCPSPTV
jgi:hypothetical protein